MTLKFEWNGMEWKGRKEKGRKEKGRKRNVMNELLEKDEKNTTKPNLPNQKVHYE